MIRQKIGEFVQKLKEANVPIWRIYLFGSHARGLARPDSDIDLAVFLDKDDIGGFEEDVELMRLRRDIDVRIEPHAFARTDFDEMTPFVQEIIEMGERIV